jgi:acyl dehydratase
LPFTLVAGLVGVTGIFEDSLMAWFGEKDISLQALVRIGDTIRVVAEVIKVYGKDSFLLLHLLEELR